MARRSQAKLLPERLLPGDTQQGRAGLVAGDDRAAVRVYQKLAATVDLGSAEWERRKVLASIEKLAAADPGNAEWQRDLSICYVRLGNVLVAAGDCEAGLAAYREARTVIETLAAAHPDNAEWQRDLTLCHVSIGDGLLVAGNGKGARDAYRQALAVIKAVAAAHPDNAEWQRDLTIFCRGRISDVQRNRGAALNERVRDQGGKKELVSKETGYIYRERGGTIPAQAEPALDGMEDMAARFRAVAKDEGIPARVLRKLIDDWKATEAKHSARETTKRRAKAKPRLKWGMNNRPDEDPATFAWRAYQAEAKAGTLHRGLIGQEDEALAVKLGNWLRTHKMPEGIDIPTKPEWNTRQLEKLGIAASSNDDPAALATLRLYEVARKRRERVAAPG